MEIVFIRHGAADYAPCWERGFIGHGKDLACLKPEGIKQAEEVSKNPVLDGSELIISSPYTRALQTAAIISKNIQLDIVVEIDLHEFLPDKTFQATEKEDSELHKDFVDFHGVYPTGEIRKWETVGEIKNRAVAVMKKYCTYNKIIVVAHGGVIRRFTGVAEVNHCTPYVVNFDESFTGFDFI